MSILKFVCVLLSLKFGTAVISDDDYQLLPQLYDMDDYLSCNTEKNVFCKIKLVLNPRDKRDKLWQVIEKTKTEMRYIKRDVLFRARCIPKEYLVNYEKALAYITDLENRKTQNISIEAHVQSIDCEETQLTKVGYSVLWLLLAYLAVVSFSTIVDVLRIRNREMKVPNQSVITVFSVLNNWESLRKPKTGEDFNRLKSFQGLRVFYVSIMIGCHSIAATATMFVANLRFLEDITTNTIKNSLITFSVHVIQPNFLMSGWLLTIQVYNDARSNNNIVSGKFMARSLLQRYLRFTIPVMFYFGLNYLILVFFPGPQTSLTYAGFKGCQMYWWMNLLQMHNFVYVENMCNFASWYLSCDFQLHVVAMALFYLMYKYNFGIKLFGIILPFAIMVNACILYNAYTSSDIETVVACPVSADFFILENVLKNDHAFVFHTSFFPNFSSYLIGILFGHLYYRHRRTKIEVSKITTVMWAIGFYGFQVPVFVLPLYNYSPIVSAIIGSLLKPLFSLGVAIGVLGMSYNIGGFVKKLCESSTLEFISRWIFSIYLFHLIIVFYGLSKWTNMLELSTFLLVKVFFTNIILSIALGLILYLIFEKPMMNVISAITTKLFKTKTN